eukprot:gene33122-42839_t
MIVSLMGITQSKRYAQQSGEWATIVPRKSAPVNHRKMLETQALNPNKNAFEHVKHLVSAVGAKKSAFRVYEEVDTTAEKDPTSYKDIVSAELYNLTASYSLFPHHKYFSLDSENDQAQTILDIQKDYVDICAEGVTAGDYLIASDSAYWFNSDPIWSANVIGKVGLILSRTVVRVDPLNLIGSHVNCKRAKTENVTPFQLFESIRVDTTSRLPFSHFINSKDANERQSKKTADQSKNLRQGNAQKRGLFTGAGPDAPVVACTSPVIEVDDQAYVQEHQGQDDDYMIVSGYTDGCASILKDFLSEIGSSFNFNYNPSTNSASSSYDLVAGITCSNCYAYLGVYIYGVFEYADYGAEMAFEAKLDGGIGFNIQLSLSSATYSGSDTITLMSASSSSVSIPLGFGLSFSTSFGGLTATVSAAASTSGSANMGAGASANAYIGLEYDYEFNSDEQGYFSFPTNAELSYTAPYLSYSDLEINSLDLTLVLAATENFNLGYKWLGFEWIGADFALVLSGTAEVSYSSSSSSAATSSMSVTTGEAVENPSAVKAMYFEQQTTDFTVMRPGDNIPITVNINGFHPGENVVLFFSFLREDYSSKVGVPLFKTEFIVPSNGSAAVTTHWQVPWDLRFLQNPSSDSLKACRIAVRGSNKMSNTYYSSDFLILADSMTDSLVSAPKNGDTLVAGTSTLINWNYENLKFFKYRPGTGGHGTLVTVQKVSILLVKESFVGGKSSQKPIVTTYNLTKDGFVNNNGSAKLIIPEEAYQWTNGTVSQRFFIKVQSHRWSNLAGWSLGHFNVIHMSQSAKLLETHYEKAADSNRYPAVNFDNFRFGHRKKYAVKDEPVKRSTSTCTTTVTISAAIDGSLTDVVVCEIPFPVGLSTGEINIYDSGAICVDDTSFNPVPTTAPVLSPPTGHSNYYYFASLETSSDDNVPNTISTSDGISNAPTAAPVVEYLSNTSQDGNRSSMNVLLGSVIGAGIILIALVVVIARWSGLAGGSPSKKEVVNHVTCITSSPSVQGGNLAEESPESGRTALEEKEKSERTALEEKEEEAVNNPMQN